MVCTYVRIPCRSDYGARHALTVVLYVTDFRYSITLGNPTPPLFRIGNENGQFMVLKSLDREQAAEYTLRVRARDMANDTTPKSNVTTVKVVVVDVNDNRPIFKYDSFS